jgi:hypothetical protein
VAWLVQCFLKYFTDSVHDEFGDADVFEDVDPNDLSKAEENLRYLIQNKLDEVGVAIERSEVDRIIQAFDVEKRSEKFFEDDPEPDYDMHPHRGGFHIDEIDDLFERG